MYSQLTLPVAIRLAFRRLNQPNVRQCPRHLLDVRARSTKRLDSDLAAAVLVKPAYFNSWHPDLDIRRVEFIALVEIVSGSPLNQMEQTPDFSRAWRRAMRKLAPRDMYQAIKPSHKTLLELKYHDLGI